MVIVAAAYALKDKALEQYYIWKLNSDDVKERDGATVKLGKMRSVRAIPLLVEILKDEETIHEIHIVGNIEHLRQTPASTALIRIGRPSVPPLIELLGNSSPITRGYAVAALRQMGRPRAEEAIPTIKGLLRDENELVRQAAARALKDIQGED